MLKIKFKTGLSGCPNCGNDMNILDGDKYCSECGQRLDWWGYKGSEDNINNK